MHEPWERLPAAWSSTSPEPQLSQLVQLHAEIAERWLAESLPAVDQVERDLAYADDRANIQGVETDKARKAMTSSYRLLSLTIAQRVGHLSPILSALFLRHALVSPTPFLSGVATEGAVHREAMLACMLAQEMHRLGFEHDPEFFAPITEYLMPIIRFGVHTARAELGEELATTANAGTETTPAVGANELTSAIRGVAGGTKTVSDYLTELLLLDRRALPSFLELVADNDVPGFDFSTLTPGRVIALRFHADALYQSLVGDWQRCLTSADDGIGALLEECESTKKELDNWDRVHLLRLFGARTEARAALGIEPVLDDLVIALMGKYSTSLVPNWLDFTKDETWWSDWDANFSTHAIIRILAVASGAITTPTAGSEVSIDGFNRLLTALETLPPLASRLDLLEVLNERLDHVVDIALDIKSGQQTIAEILIAAGEKRIAGVKQLMSDVAPDWDALQEESKRELVAAELEYRAFLAGEREDVHPAAIANLFYRPIERELNRIAGLFDPPNWKMFRSERHYADHADEFGSIDITRMRAYLFGMYRGKDSLLASVARTAKRRATHK
ncbi:MAG: hypothetical protein M3P30_16515 [Chloroflexota bacterium]|nr:hypothetical protein [Chloroflexota bacterium]